MKIGQLLGVGNTANVYEWGKSEVIKIFHDPHAAIHEAAKEAQKAELINKCKVRAPKFSGMIEYEGKPCLIYEKVEGPTMFSSIQQTTRSVSCCARLMAQLHFELHQIEIDIRPNVKTELSKCINNTHEISKPEKAFVLNILEKLPEGHVICHYDFHPGNIILSPNGPMIIDWLNMLVGHHTADVTRTFMLIHSAAIPPSAPAWLSVEGFREQFSKAYLNEYFQLSGIHQSALDDWLAPTFAARICELKGEERLEIANQLKSILKVH